MNGAVSAIVAILPLSVPAGQNCNRSRSSYIYPGRMAEDNYIMSWMFPLESRSSGKLRSGMFLSRITLFFSHPKYVSFGFVLISFFQDHVISFVVPDMFRKAPDKCGSRYYNISHPKYVFFRNILCFLLYNLLVSYVFLIGHVFFRNALSFFSLEVCLFFRQFYFSGIFFFHTLVSNVLY